MNFLDQHSEEIMSIVGMVATLFMAWLAPILHKKYNIDLEAAKKQLESIDREALHRALDTAAALAASFGLSGQEAVDFIKRHVLKSTPEAMVNLSPDTQTFTNLATAKLIEKETKSVEDFAAKQGVPVDQLRRSVDNLRVAADVVNRRG